MARTLNRDGKLGDNNVRIIRQQSLFDGQVSREDVVALCNEVIRLRTLERNVIKLWNEWGSVEEGTFDETALWEDFGRAIGQAINEAQVPGVI